MNKLYAVLALFILVILGLGINDYMNQQEGVRSLEKAEKLYQRGVAASNYDEKMDAFNESLDVLLKYDRQIPAIDAAIAANLVELREYPLAVYYYRQALYRDPSLTTVQKQMNKILARLGLPEEPYTSAVERLSRFAALSFLEIKKLCLIAFCIVFVLFSLWIWYPEKWVRNLFALSLIPFLFLGGVMLVRNFLNPIEAVVVTSTNLYQGSGTNYPLVSSKPLTAGVSVTVLDVPDNGQWLKVRTSDNTLGFLPAKNARIVL